ncbi:MAG: hypothetical protein E7224_01645 [Clostridiales bacterium]|nr:hypothetical protein [Clostridiales bacterium]
MFLMKHSKKVALVIVILLAVFEVFSATIMPNKMVVQMDMDGGDGLILPTPLGLIIFFAVSLATSWRMTAVPEAKDKKKWLVATLFVIFINAVLVLYNVMY